MAPSSSLITLSIFALAIIAYLTYSHPIQPVPRHRQQAEYMPNTGKNDSYTAPVIECDGPEEEIVKDDHQVFLHQGYSLDQHKTFVGEAVDFDSAIQSILNETASHGLLYRAWLNEDALAAVRADIGVDLVNCNVRSHPE